MVARRSARRGGDEKGGEKVENPRDISPPDSPFFGFSNADIPQPILIKTEPLEVPEEGTADGLGADDDECVVVKVTRAAKPLPKAFIKKEKEDENDVDIFHGFSLQELPRPIVIKEEAVENEEEVTVERGESASIPEYWVKQPEVPLGPVVPGDDLCDEFTETAAAATSAAEVGLDELQLSTSLEEAPMNNLESPGKLQESPTAALTEKSVVTSSTTIRSPQRLARSPQRSLGSPNRPTGSPQMKSLGSPQRLLGSLAASQVLPKCEMGVHRGGRRGGGGRGSRLSEGFLTLEQQQEGYEEQAQMFVNLFRYISGVNKEQDEVAMTALVMTSMKMLDGNEITMEMFFYIGKKHQANCNQSEVHSLCAHLWRLGHEGCSEHQGGQEVCQGAGEGRQGGEPRRW